MGYDNLEDIEHEINESPVIKPIKHSFNINYDDMLKRFFKYVIMTFCIALLLRIVPDKPLQWRPVFTISMVATVIFFIIDSCHPTIGISNSAEVIIGK